MTRNSVFFLLPAAALCAYNESLAYQFANIAGAAYCHLESVANWSCGDKCIAGVHSIEACKGTSTHAFAGKLDDKCFLSFEGTHNAASILIDLQSTKDQVQTNIFRCPHCFVHSGFISEWNSHKKCIVDAVKRIGCGTSSSPLYFTGHSL